MYMGVGKELTIKVYAFNLEFPPAHLIQARYMTVSREYLVPL
jgi:hypothetical protein